MCSDDLCYITAEEEWEALALFVRSGVRQRDRGLKGREGSKNWEVLLGGK